MSIFFKVYLTLWVIFIIGIVTLGIWNPRVHAGSKMDGFGDWVAVVSGTAGLIALVATVYIAFRAIWVGGFAWL